MGQNLGLVTDIYSAVSLGETTLISRVSQVTVGRMKVLAIYNHPVERLGSLPVRAEEKRAEEIEGNEDFDFLIVLGGPMGVYEADKYPFLFKEMELIRRAYVEGKRVLGICLGAQLIAKALGGEVVRGGFGREVGVVRVKNLSDFKNIFGEELEVFQWHGDTFSLPKGAELLAYNEKYFQAFKMGKAVGLQFHVEVDSKMVREWVSTYGGNEKLIEEVKSIEEKLKEASKKIVEYMGKFL